MSKWDVYGDRDFDGDVDFTDRLIEDEEFEELLDDEAKRTAGFDNDDDDDDLDLLDADDNLDTETADMPSEIVIPVTITVGVDVADDEIEAKPAMPKKVSKDRISSDFIIRNREKEKEFGIADMHFYCYWMHGFSGVLLIIGELFTTDTFTKPFQLKATVVDEDGDKIMVNENFDYTGGGGLVCRSIYPNIGFSRYPFQFELHISPKKLKKCKVKLTPVVADEALKSMVSPITIPRVAIKGGVSMPDLEQYDKFPKARIRQIHQPGTGLTELNMLFFKENENNEDGYFANQLQVNYDYSGKLATDLLMYILVYNDSDELIDYSLKRLDEGARDEEDDSEFLNIPHDELISRIDVITTTHPVEFYNPKFF